MGSGRVMGAWSVAFRLDNARCAWDEGEEGGIEIVQNRLEQVNGPHLLVLLLVPFLILPIA